MKQYLRAHVWQEAKRARQREVGGETNWIQKRSNQVWWKPAERRRWPTRVQLQSDRLGSISPQYGAPWLVQVCVCVCVWTGDMGSGPWRRHCQYGGGHSWAAALSLPSRERAGATDQQRVMPQRRGEIKVADWQDALDPFTFYRNCPAAD